MDPVKGSAVAVGILVGGGLWFALPEPPPAEAPASLQAEAASLPPARASGEPRPLLRYFYLPDCPGCAEARVLLSEVESEAPDVRFDCASALDEPSEAVIEREFIPAGQDHGALLLDPSGKAVWRLPGHDFDRRAIEEGLARTRGNRKGRSQ